MKTRHLASGLARRFTPALGPILARTLGAVALALAGLSSADAASRIKDIADIEGVRENQLVGYGLVVGLNGTGDSLSSSPFTLQSLQSMLERLGVNTRDARLRTANVAAVMVTGNLPPFATQGTRMDITVSALGDSTSLQGGTLLVTPLLGADGEVYAVAQGPVAISGFAAGGDAATIVRGVPTVGRIASGALVERHIPFEIEDMSEIRLSLRNPDMTTATRTADAINRFIGPETARATDPATVVVALMGKAAMGNGSISKGSLAMGSAGHASQGDLVALLTDIEQLMIEPDLPAKVVIDESSGIIVIGSQVRISQVAVAQGNLTVSVTESPEISQPAPFSPRGETAALPRTDLAVDDQSERRLAVVGGSVNLQDLVNGLNALGIGPRDMISILQAVKAAGALQAEIELM